MTRRDQRLTLAAATLGSFVARLDSTVVGVALPAIGGDLGGGLESQQWIVNAYLLALGSLILIGGSLGDVFGERRLFLLGAAGFAVASAACAAAPSVEALITARGLQGVFGALLTPASLAVIVATFAPDERGKAIGTWTAFSGIAAVVGPLVGGWLVDNLGWRWIFAIGLPFIAVALLLAIRMPAAAPARIGRRPDWLGAGLCAFGLAGPTLGLVRQPGHGWSDALVVFLQQVAGYSALEAAAATIPTTVVLFALSQRFGALADRGEPNPRVDWGPWGDRLGHRRGTCPDEREAAREQARGMNPNQRLPKVAARSLRCVPAVSETDAVSFVRARPRLFGIARRVLGSAADADDVVQEAWMRWLQTDRSQVRDPAAFLATTTTRLALNVGQTARARHETDFGPRLLDAVDPAADPVLDAEHGEALERALRTVLEKLSGPERAVYVLREAFDYPHRRIAEVVGLSEANARQLVTRARRRIAGEPRWTVDAAELERLVEAFVAAAQSGDLEGLEQLLAGGSRVRIAA